MSEKATISVTTGGGGARRMARLENGEAIWQEVTQDELEAYVAPPAGTYHLKITGLGEPWERPKNPNFIKEGGPTTEVVIRVEFEVQEGKGKGRRFTALPTLSINEMSNLGQIWLAAIGPIPPKAEVTDLLEKEFRMMVDRNESFDSNGNKRIYAKPIWKTAKPMSAEPDADDEWPAA
jgi:hypothetical protein